MSDERVPVLELREGDLIDLEHDHYANLPCSDGPECEDCDSTKSTFEYEYAVVLSVEEETPGCVVVHTSATSFGCPPDHKAVRITNDLG